MDQERAESLIEEIVAAPGETVRAFRASAFTGALAARTANLSAFSLRENFTGPDSKRKRLDDVIRQTEELRQWFSLPVMFDSIDDLRDALDVGHSLVAKLVMVGRLAAEITHKSEPLGRAQPAGAGALALAAARSASLALRQLLEGSAEAALCAEMRTKMNPLDHELASLVELIHQKTEAIHSPPEIELPTA